MMLTSWIEEDPRHGPTQHQDGTRHPSSPSAANVSVGPLFARRTRDPLPSVSSSSLLYDKDIGTTVSLRPTAPATFRHALVQKAAGVQDLTLMGFGETAAAHELLHLVRLMSSLRSLTVVSLDLWSASHLQSTTALAVGSNLGALVAATAAAHTLQVLRLKRTCMGRSPAHLQAFARALRNHPSLQVLTMDVHSTQLEISGSGYDVGGGGGGELPPLPDDTHQAVLTLDPLLDALATCPQLSRLQIYLSGYKRGTIKDATPALASLVQQLDELSLHMVSMSCPRRNRTNAKLLLMEAAQKTQTLETLHWTMTTSRSNSSSNHWVSFPWADFLLVNSSLTSVSLSVPSICQRTACWKAVSRHPRISSACFSLCHALRRHVPSFRKAAIRLAAWPEEGLFGEREQDRWAECHAMALALSENSRLVHVPLPRELLPQQQQQRQLSTNNGNNTGTIGNPTALQALLRFNQGPRGVFLKDAVQWWNLLNDNANNLDALWLLLRLHPECVNRHYNI